MKKDRNCGCGGNMYPTYQQPMMPMQPMIQQPMYGGMPMNQQMMPQMGMNSSLEQQVSNLNSQVTSLERRVRALESLVGSSNNSQYNTSNYQMM